mgnify:CR=1 FL=1
MAAHDEKFAVPFKARENDLPTLFQTVRSVTEL